MVAQSLSAHSEQWLAPILRSRRISRIAVMDKWRRRGIALRIVLAEKQTAQRLDFLSVSFGYTDELSAFWHACGFKLVRIGSHKEASSGMLYGDGDIAVEYRGKNIMSIVTTTMGQGSDLVAAVAMLSFAHK